MLRTLALATLLLFALLWTMLTMAESAFVAHAYAAAQGSVQAWPERNWEVTAGKVITVTNVNDEVNSDGDCSLHEAILAADTDTGVDACAPGNASNGGGDTLLLPAGHFQLTSGQITLTGIITLQGSISETTILDAMQVGRVVYIPAGATVVLSHLEIRNGLLPAAPVENASSSPIDGGGILNSGTTTIVSSVIHGNKGGTNSGYGGQGGEGGGIFNDGIMALSNSTISGNRGGDGMKSPWDGRGSYCGGGGEGGGIANHGTVSIDHVTITENSPGFSCDYGSGRYPGNSGGIYNIGPTDDAEQAKQFTFRNSIIAGNEGSDCSGSLLSLGNNLVQTLLNCTIEEDFWWWTPYIDPLLSDNGGPTLTHTLDAFSPAVDAGDCLDSNNQLVTVDQRGMARPQGGGCDMGAFESPYPSTFAYSATVLAQISFEPARCILVTSACNLTNSAAANEGSAAWSPDGQRIAFTRYDFEENGERIAQALFVMNADGTNPRLLLEMGEGAEWSPDSTRIIFSSAHEGNVELYLVSANGGDPQRLTNTPALVESGPVWSPDGSKILYRGNLFNGTATDYETDIYLMNADGSQSFRLVMNGEMPLEPWSPDGSKILLANQYIPFISEPQQAKIHIFAQDGSNHIEIGSDAEVNSSPSWSPDGSQIAFQCNLSPPSDPQSICVINSDGSNRQVINMGGESVTFPVWSPTTDQIAYLCTHSLCVVQSDGTHRQILVASEYLYVPFRWSPDGSKLLMNKNPHGGYEPWEMVVIHADGTQPRTIAKQRLGEYGSGPGSWSPDSSIILYARQVFETIDLLVQGADLPTSDLFVGDLQ